MISVAIGLVIGILLMTLALPYLFCYFLYRLFGGRRGLFSFFKG